MTQKKKNYEIGQFFDFFVVWKTLQVTINWNEFLFGQTRAKKKWKLLVPTILLNGTEKKSFFMKKAKKFDLFVLKIFYKTSRNSLPWNISKILHFEQSTFYSKKTENWGLLPFGELEFVQKSAATLA